MPTPVITNNVLGWAFQTSFVNNVKRPSQFLKQLYFEGREQNVPTESIEYSFKEGDRLLAPFVEVNGEAVSVGGRSVTFANISAPNIKLKRAMDAYNSLLRRLPNTDVFITGGDAVLRARMEAVAEDTEFMEDMILNREEWMVAKMLTDTTSGSINLEYAVAEKANFKITIPRHTDMTVALTGGAAEWDDNTGAGIKGDFMKVKRAFSKHLNRTARICIMGSGASDLFLGADSVVALLDKRNVSAGTLELINQFNDMGAIYLGTFCGIPCWEYSREYIDDITGAATPFIPANVAVFLSGGNNEGKMVYGAIPDHDAMDQGLLMSKRFAKSWKIPDPSSQVQLLQSRPLPLIRQPNAHYVLTVT